jgi:hypothetical protein
MENEMKTTEQIIRDSASPMLLQEVDDYLEMAIEEQWESVTCLEDAFREISDRSDQDGWENFVKPVRKVHIALGEYVPISEEDIAMTWCSSGKAWDFKMDGIKYRWAG